MIHWHELETTDPDVVLVHRALEDAHQCVSEGLWCHDCGTDAKHAVADLRNAGRLDTPAPVD